MESKVVSCSIFNPCNSIFKHPANARAECTVVRCSLEKCPLRESGTCTWIPPIGYDACPYGKVSCSTGYTKRAGKFSSWIREKEKEYEGIPSLKYPHKRLAFIGDYVYLPYAHIDLNESVPFIRHSHYFVSGCRFIHKNAWNIKNILSIIDFRPRAMMGGEIRQYQEKEIPKFLSHVRESDVDMWNQIIKERPELDKEPNYVGRKALLKTVKPGIKWTTDKSYPVKWWWNGEKVITIGLNAYNSTWGDVKLKSMDLKAIPADDATIIIKDNSWVTENTEFVD